MYVRKEAVLSSQIEGTQSSLQDVLNAEARILAPDRPQDAYEVINYVGAMNHGLARLKELPLSIRLIREIHGLLLAGGRRESPATWRTASKPELDWSAGMRVARCLLRSATPRGSSRIHG